MQTPPTKRLARPSGNLKRSHLLLERYETLTLSMSRCILNRRSEASITHSGRLTEQDYTFLFQIASEFYE
jgi:hypothetical protein